MVWCRWD